MNKKVLALVICLLLVVAVAIPFAMAGKKKGGKRSKVKPECDDKIDNDGDGFIDCKWDKKTKTCTADAGCTNKKDNDESNCEDGVCEGGETSETCPEDCGTPDSCDDTDGGFIPLIQGTVYGYSSGDYYNYTDYCQDTVMLREYYCSSNNPTSNVITCAGNTTSICMNGACV